MAQPRSYTQTNTFNDWTTTNPSDPHIGSKFDTEFTELKQNTDDINTNIALIQRDDGKIKNEAIHKDAFDQDALALIGASGSGFAPKGDWAASTDYISGDIVNNNNATYLTATTSHTSGSTFSGDQSTYWILIANSAISTTGASVNMASGDGSNRVFTTAYKYTDVEDIQVFISGVLVATNLYTISNASGNNITFTTAPASGTNNVIIWGDSVVSQAAAAATLGYRDTTNNHKTTAERWSDKVDGSVVDAETSIDSSEYSAKAYAVGGTGVTTTLNKGAAKQWATTTGGFVDTADYSAKEYAQGSHLAAGGSAKNWAILATTPTTGTTDASAREWAIGTSTHKGDASAKEYATSAQYDSVEGSAEYSAKHYSAQAQDWAVKTTIVRNDANGADVDYSSKEWAAGQLAANTSGSAKQWSIGGGAFVEATAVTGSSYSAKKYATDSAASAAAALTSEGNAATTYDNFDDRFLGPHTTAEREVGAANIGKDHDGSALVAGAMYFDTTLTIMKVWSGSVWQRMQPTTAEQTNIDAAVADAVDIGKVAAKDTEIGRLGAAAYSDGASAYLALLGTAAMANSTDGDIKVVADNIVDVNNFAVRYRTGTTDPTTALDDGDLFWNQTSDELKIYNTTASAWQVPYLDSASVNAEATNAAISMAIALG
jgi:hypothetical protein